MKRHWFSLCLLRLEQRNEVCEFQESSKISGIILQGVFALSHSPLCRCRYIIRSSLKQLTRNHYLLIIWSLQASSCSKVFNCATKAITSTFSMRGCRKMRFSMHSKMFFMMAQVDEILVFFVLGCCSIKKAVIFLRIWRQFSSQISNQHFWNR